MSMLKTQTYSVIAGSGSYLPTRVISNTDFLNNTFYDETGNQLGRPTEEIVRGFSDITGIYERRYVTDDLVASDIAYFAAADAIRDAGTDPEQLDYIIFAHNFGDIRADNARSEFVPTLASRVKYRLGIKNPATVCYDLPFGCAGWLQGVIQADLYIRSGQAKKVLIVGGETLSRISDPHDRDSMLYADGAGAIVLEARESDTPVGILSTNCHTYTAEQAYVLRMGKSNYPDHPQPDRLFLKMQGRVLYEHALKVVPLVTKESMDKAGLDIKDMDMLLIHQANKKMDEAMMRRLYEAFGAPQPTKNVMPLTVSWLGNSSVATLPTLYNLVEKGEMPGYSFHPGNNLVFASVGAGVNVNALVYRIPGEK
ncbi:3-oxoacyl-ACP synthase III family protein [Mucilaginibacter flavidus]|uniref:3-oxoacyl-ACP synthase III family protein n=1 Tax=Mucilaginibacter flavidus TaxID=2949309 RepID=UPI00209374C3|nr:ketoacyl-ACP synthase III [Mucilaginibacter flavidus]